MVNYKVISYGGIVLGIAGVFLSGKLMVDSSNKIEAPEEYVETTPVVQEYNNIINTLEIVNQKCDQLQNQRVTYEVDYKLPGLESFLNRNFGVNTLTGLDSLQQYRDDLEERAAKLDTIPEVAQYNDDIKNIQEKGIFGSGAGLLGTVLSAILIGVSLTYGIRKANVHR